MFDPAAAQADDAQLIADFHDRYRDEPDVIDAVAQGRFHIYPVRTIDEGLELLTGIPAGGSPGVEPINDAAARRLKFSYVAAGHRPR